MNGRQKYLVEFEAEPPDSALEPDRPAGSLGARIPVETPGHQDTAPPDEHEISETSPDSGPRTVPPSPALPALIPEVFPSDSGAVGDPGVNPSATQRDTTVEECTYCAGARAMGNPVCPECGRDLRIVVRGATGGGGCGCG